MSAETPIANVASLFFQCAEEQPKVIAIYCKNDQISYQKLATEVKKYAAFLTEKGVKKSDRILIFLPISIRLYAVVLAVMQVGAVAVFLDPWSDLKRLKASAKSADCKTMIAGRKLRWLSRILPVFRKIPLKLKPSATREKMQKKVQTIDPDDTALITFTTGSSGAPKGANRTHEFLQCQLKALRQEIEPLKRDVCLTNLPVFTLSHLADGITSVIADYNPRKPSKMKAENILRQLRQHAVQTLVVSPDFLMRLAKGATAPVQSSLKRIFTGGAPVFPDQAQQIARVFPNIKTVVAYGSTEAEPISSIPLPALLADEDLLQGGLPVGTLHPDCKVQIIAWREEVIQPKGDSLNKLEKPEGEIGEIIVSGPHVLREYYKNPIAQRRQKFVVNGQLWHRTGDSGFLRANQLYLTGPCQQLIEEGGGFIAPFLIEYQLRKLATVQEATLIERGGEKTLCLVKRESASKKQVEEELTRGQIPYNEIRYLKALPKDPRHNSKIDYAKLV